MAPFPLSKMCDLKEDAPHLVAATHLLDGVPDLLTGQHAIRRWEYAMAIHAIAQWDRADQGTTPREICDVGGAGSHFWQALALLTTVPIDVVDAALPTTAPVEGARFWSIGIEALAANGWVGHDQFDIITCISVIEHVKELRPFLRAIRMLLKPGGLLVLTTDAWDAEGPDVAHFHWMRERIYNAERMQKLLQDCRELGYKTFGTTAWAYPGPMVYDYSVASAALIKRV